MPTWWMLWRLVLKYILLLLLPSPFFIFKWLYAIYYPASCTFVKNRDLWIQVLNPPSYHIPPLNKKRKIKLINGIVLFVEIDKPNELPMMAKERKIIGAD